MNEISPAGITYGLVSGAFRVVSHIFFREIKTSGAHHVPMDSPVIFLVGPHHSQFVDGVVFFGINPRPSYALMAAVSYNRPLIGHFGKILNASKSDSAFLLSFSNLIFIKKSLWFDLKIRSVKGLG